MTEQEFINDIKKVKGSRQHSIVNSIGVEDFIKHYKKINNRISIETIRKVIKQTNIYLANELVQGNEIKLPRQMGSLELRSNPTYVKFENGKIKTNRVIDWNATLKLWFKDKEAKNRKQLVRTENKKIFSVFYNKGKAKYNNKVFFEFIPNRTVKQTIKENINNGIITDTFLLS